MALNFMEMNYLYDFFDIEFYTSFRVQQIPSDDQFLLLKNLEKIRHTLLLR